MNIELNELLALAEKATPGPWRCYGFPMFEPKKYFGVQVEKPSNIMFDDANKQDAEFITAANPVVVADIIKRLLVAEELNAMNIQKLGPKQGDFILATVDERMMKSREDTLKGTVAVMNRAFPEHRIIFLADWLKLECLGEKQLQQLGLAVIEKSPLEDSSKPSVQHIEQLANALVKQAQELKECGPEEWASVSDMVEGALNNIRFDMKEGACSTN